VFSAAAGV